MIEEVQDVIYEKIIYHELKCWVSENLECDTANVSRNLILTCTLHVVSSENWWNLPNRPKFEKYKLRHFFSDRNKNEKKILNSKWTNPVWNDRRAHFTTIGKQSPSYLSFVYTLYISVPVRTALNFGKHAVSFWYYNLKFDTYTVICTLSVKLLSFSTNYFLLAFSDYLEHSWNSFQHGNAI